jgi:hypothetical protein
MVTSSLPAIQPNTGRNYTTECWLGVYKRLMLPICLGVDRISLSPWLVSECLNKFIPSTSSTWRCGGPFLPKRRASICLAGVPKRAKQAASNAWLTGGHGCCWSSSVVAAAATVLKKYGEYTRTSGIGCSISEQICFAGARATCDCDCLSATGPPPPAPRPRRSSLSLHSCWAGTWQPCSCRQWLLCALAPNVYHHAFMLVNLHLYPTAFLVLYLVDQWLSEWSIVASLVASNHGTHHACVLFAFATPDGPELLWRLASYLHWRTPTVVSTPARAAVTSANCSCSLSLLALLNLYPTMMDDRMQQPGLHLISCMLQASSFQAASMRGPLAWPNPKGKD